MTPPHNLNLASGQTEADSVRPYFIPPGIAFEEFPAALQATILDIINPAYRDLVLEARDGLEKSVGVSMVYLIWREILLQLKHGQDLGRDGVETEETSQARQKQLDEYLRLVNAKRKQTYLLVRLADIRRKLGPLSKPLPPFEAKVDPSWPFAPGQPEPTGPAGPIGQADSTEQYLANRRAEAIRKVEAMREAARRAESAVLAAGQPGQPLERGQSVQSGEPLELAADGQQDQTGS